MEPISKQSTSVNGLLSTMQHITAILSASISYLSGKLTSTALETSGAPRTNLLSTCARLTSANGPLTVSFFISSDFYLLDIWRACREGDLDMVRILLREGQNVNEQT